MNGICQSLLANLALAAGVGVVWSAVRERVEHRGLWLSAAASGAVMGGGAVLLMFLALSISSGLIFDLRVVPLAMAGFFGGPLGAVAAAMPALAYRAWLGGVGGVPGCLVVAVTPAVAAGLRRVARRHASPIRALLLLAALVPLVHLASYLLLPADLAVPTLRRFGPWIVVLDAAGLLVGGLSALGDERRRELTRQNTLYRAVFEAHPDGLSVKDLDGRITAANPAAAHLAGVAAAADLVGKTDDALYPAATAQAFRIDDTTVVTTRRPAATTRRITSPDGRDTWVSSLKIPLANARGEVTGVITHGRDVTQAKAMGADLQRARQRLADALAHMADGLVMFDAQGVIALCNEQYTALFPVTADIRVPGTHMSDLIRQGVARGEVTLQPGVDVEGWIAMVLARLRTDGEWTVALADGRLLEGRTRPMADGGSLTVFSDITARKRQEDALRRRAEEDSLTGLANRSTFDVRLARACDEARARGTEVGVMLVDLDRFKQVNDTFGHQVGDRLLVEVARRLRAACRGGDVIARLGGDEFAVLVEGPELAADMRRLARRVQTVATRPFRAGDVDLLPSGSIGFAVFPRDGDGPDTLVAHADEALYAAKAAGRCRWIAYAGAA